MIWRVLDPRYSLNDAVGLLPASLADSDPRGACEQFAERYVGGWCDCRVGEGWFTSFDNFSKLRYPKAPPLHALAETTLHDGDRRDGVAAERIVVYESAYVAVIQGDGSFRVSRLD